MKRILMLRHDAPLTAYFPHINDALTSPDPDFQIVAHISSIHNAREMIARLKEFRVELWTQETCRVEPKGDHAGGIAVCFTMRKTDPALRELAIPLNGT